MKQIGAILFMSCFLLMTFSKALTLANFYINQDAITAKFCVNKNKPKMHCNGKCYLAKQIKEQKQREAANAVMELSKIEVVSSVSYFINDLESTFTELHITFNHFSEPILNTPRPTLLKPPCA